MIDASYLIVRIANYDVQKRVECRLRFADFISYRTHSELRPPLFMAFFVSAMIFFISYRTHSELRQSGNSMRPFFAKNLFTSYLIVRIANYDPVLLSLGLDVRKCGAFISYRTHSEFHPAFISDEVSHSSPSEAEYGADRHIQGQDQRARQHNCYLRHRCQRRKPLNSPWANRKSRA